MVIYCQNILEIMQIICIKNTLPITNLYYDKYTNTELDIIYKKVNDDLTLIN